MLYRLSFPAYRVLSFRGWGGRGFEVGRWGVQWLVRQETSGELHGHLMVL